jgi:hypothetical protein
VGTLYAYLPSHELAAIEPRLRREARRNVAADDDAAIDPTIAVTIPADVLTGFTPGFAESTDGRWAVPAAWLDDVIRAGTTFWHRIITDPVTDDILHHEYAGRWPQPRAERSKAGAWAASEASRAPLGPLCRRHHQMKGHGVLRWSTRPTEPPREVVYELWRDPINVEYAGRARAA